MANKERVRAYYARNRGLVACRRALSNTYMYGSIPRAESVLKHGIPLLAIYVAFGEWASISNPSLIRRQQLKLRKLRSSLERRSSGPSNS